MGRNSSDTQSQIISPTESKNYDFLSFIGGDY